MLTTKKTAKSIGAEYKEPYQVKLNGKRIKADYKAIAEINAQLMEDMKAIKSQAVESKILAKIHYAGG